MLDTTLKQFIMQFNYIAKKKRKKKWRLFFVKFYVLCYIKFWLSAAVIHAKNYEHYIWQLSFDLLQPYYLQTTIQT